MIRKEEMGSESSSIEESSAPVYEHFSKDKQKELKAASKTLKASIQMGKNGFTPELTAQIKLALKKRKLVKVRMLKSYIEEHDKRETAVNLANACNAHLIDLTGFMVTLYRR